MNSVNKLLESVWLHEWDWYKKRERRRLKNAKESPDGTT